MERPLTKYARNGDINIAYQAFGAGDVTILYAQGWLSNVEYTWESPEYARFLTRLTRSARVIMFDKRGTGMSDREFTHSTLEERADDILAVLNAENVEDAVLFGVSEGGNMSTMFSVMYPERTRALVLYGCSARAQWAPDYPWGQRREDFERETQALMAHWGEPFNLEHAAPSMANNAQARNWFAAYLRFSASPKSAERYMRVNFELDIRDVLPAVQAPTLVLQREHDHWTATEEAHLLADNLRNSKLVILPGEDHLPWYGNQGDILSEIEEFTMGKRQASQTDRVLTTLMLTDIVNSTHHLEANGDENWASVLAQFGDRTRRRVEALGGELHGDTGDGHVASFSGPSRALECAQTLRRDAVALGFDIRAGVHTGECERHADGLRGHAVHLTSRLCDTASAGRILATTTVRDLCVGSPFLFSAEGAVRLKGIPEPIELFDVQ